MKVAGEVVELGGGEEVEREEAPWEVGVLEACCAGDEGAEWSSEMPQDGVEGGMRA